MVCAVKGFRSCEVSVVRLFSLPPLHSKLKLLRIWQKLGETRPELKGDFERLVTDIGQQLAGAKDSVR